MNSGPPPREPSWGYLISHHFPGRYARTVSITIGRTRLRFCTRCSGQVLGALGFFVLVAAVGEVSAGLATVPAQLLVASLPVVAAVDWVTQALGRRESTGPIRGVSGALLGITLADALWLLVTRRWAFFGGAVAVFALYVVGVSVALYAGGGWRRVVEEHFPGVTTE